MELPDIEKHGAAYWIEELGIYQYRTHRSGMYLENPKETINSWVSSEFGLSVSEVTRAISQAIQRGPEVTHWMTDNTHYYQTKDGRVYRVVDDMVGTILPISSGDQVPLVVTTSEMARRHENSTAWKQLGSSTLKKVVKNGSLGLIGFAIGGPLGAAAAISLGNIKAEKSIT
jgi:hypothetical protein